MSKGIELTVVTVKNPPQDFDFGRLVPGAFSSRPQIIGNTLRVDMFENLPSSLNPNNAPGTSRGGSGTPANFNDYALDNRPRTSQDASAVNFTPSNGQVGSPQYFGRSSAGVGTSPNYNSTAQDRDGPGSSQGPSPLTPRSSSTFGGFSGPAPTFSRDFINHNTASTSQTGPVVNSNTGGFSGAAHTSYAMDSMNENVPSTSGLSGQFADVNAGRVLPWEPQRQTSIARFGGFSPEPAGMGRGMGRGMGPTFISPPPAQAPKRASRGRPPKKPEPAFTGVVCWMCDKKTADVMLRCPGTMHSFCKVCVEDFLKHFQACPKCGMPYSGHDDIPPIRM